MTYCWLLDPPLIPYDFRRYCTQPPEDWPIKGAMVETASGKKRRVTAHDMRVAVVKRGLVLYKTEYERDRNPQAVVLEQTALF